VTDRYGSSPPSGRAADIGRLLQEQLRQRGFLHAGVTSDLEVVHAPDSATLVFTITPGPRTQIGTLDVMGNPGIPAQKLFDRLGLAPGAPYEADVLAGRIDRYREDQRRQGFFEARLTPAVRLADGDRVANVTLEAVQGPRVRVVFSGDQLSADEREDLVPIAREGSVDEDVLEDASRAIQSHLRAQGYRDATAGHTRSQSNGELLITFSVKRGPQYRVAAIEVAGNASIPAEVLRPQFRLKVGEPFASAQLEADLQFIEELYRRQGFALARAQPLIEPAPSASADAAQQVAVTIRVTEGVQTLVASVRVDGNESVEETLLRDGLGMQPGQPFYLTQLAVDQDAIQLQYANRGYPGATVESNPGISADGASANVVFRVHEGPRIVVDHVLIAGNTRTKSEIIERELELKAGEPLGLDALIESQRRLSALGLFRRTRITEVAHGDETRRDVLVTVEEAPATTIGYGGGLEVGQRVGTDQSTGVATEQFEIAPRAFFEVGRRNLFGKNRSVNLFTRISLSNKDASQTAEYGFSEYRVLATFREPRVFNTRADAFLTGTIEQQKRTSFNFARHALSAEMTRRLTSRVGIGGSYQLQRTELFDEQIQPQDQLLVDRLFPQLRLSSFSASIVQDARDDPLNPTTGRYLSANGQLAARRIGSEVGLAKSYLTGQLFRRLPGTSNVVFAGSARLGMAVGFARQVFVQDADGNFIVGPDGELVTETLKDLPASERFFAGGDTTVRGFALDQLGTPETIDENGFPIGGNAVVIFNGELRMPVFGGFGVVAFIDSGNVFARTGDLDLSELRSTAGFGIRYRSPVGPIRIDMGFKIGRKELVAGTLEEPFAVHISLGQAF
jgi:outer membrane protein assembly complex protein YaeT